ncbi:tetratricopeptide repeat protein 38 family protein [Oceanicella actignis]|uniref:Tetratricopeptide repeat protein 38 n=1 Tax=Oceanicella actignis TaxID=1189325 RepID=A0A1M7SEK3_9RHOB|nr:tetratricopeptide repeat protein 38 family protein [Oceanicella actignis]TYO91335.1 hypothetical protein LY05_00186 [Oceanicella actignis]SET23374.1 hypothetical protein SAMN04488119_103201 [Oceanicella actignis]SHN56900.1 hypothetical protein SAMN05216200_102307 [Oceanicella actignis]
MRTDAAGHDLTLQSSEAAGAWDACVAAFLAHGAATPEHLARALAAEPGFALGHAAKGFFMLLLGRAELLPAADDALRAARAAAAQGGANAREAAYVAALSDMRAGRQRAAAARLEAIARRWPGDSLAMKLTQAVRFILGDPAGMRAALADQAPGFGADHPHRGYFLGCTAFALEETGDYAAAERAGLEGLELAPDDAWGLHAVAHVHDMTGQPERGVRWLAGQSARWAHCNNFGYHVWWHLALFHLDRGAWGPALELYDRKVWPDRTDDYRDIANAASLLMRLELEGVDVGARWEALGELCARRVDDGQVMFADLHYLLSLTRAGRAAEAEALSARIARDAERLDHDQHEVAALAALPAAQALLAFRNGDHARAHAAFARAAPRMQALGGSHAQRDVFERLAVEAALRAGLLDEAEAMLARRAARRGAEDGYCARRRQAIAARRAQGRSGGLRAAPGAA